MGDIVRLKAAPNDEDSWWVQGGGDPEEAATKTEAFTLPMDVGLTTFGDALWAVAKATDAADATVANAADALLDGINFTEAAQTVALIQDIRRRLQVVEQYLTKRLGEAASEVEARSGELPDGRLWEVRRGKNRKSWDHDGWKHDARARVAEETMRNLAGDQPVQGVLLESGELVEVNLAAVVIAAITAAQEVHGSTPPRVTQLRALGMDPDEYAETSPGPWGLVVASTDQTTTIDKD